MRRRTAVTGGYFQNIGATRRSGVELALQWQGPAGVRAYTNYGYTRATFETTATLATTRDIAGETVTPGDELPMVPRHRVNAGLAVPILRHQGKETGVALAAAVDARYVGRQWLGVVRRYDAMSHERVQDGTPQIWLPAPNWDGPLATYNVAS